MYPKVNSCILAESYRLVCAHCKHTLARDLRRFLMKRNKTIIANVATYGYFGIYAAPTSISNNWIVLSLSM